MMMWQARRWAATLVVLVAAVGTASTVAAKCVSPGWSLALEAVEMVDGSEVDDAELERWPDRSFLYEEEEGLSLWVDGAYRVDISVVQK